MCANGMPRDHEICAAVALPLSKLCVIPVGYTRYIYGVSYREGRVLHTENARRTLQGGVHHY